MERVLATVSADGRVLASRVVVWMRSFTEASGVHAWEGHFDAGMPVPPGGYEITAADGRSGVIRVTHAGLLAGQPNRAEFNGVGPFR